MGSWLRRDVFSYADKPADLLYRHYRLWRFCAVACCTACVCLFSTLFEFLTSFGFVQHHAPWVHTVELVVIVAGLLTCMMLGIPTILSVPLMNEIERVLASRGLPPPSRPISAARLGKYTLKICVYAAALIIFANYVAGR